MRGNDKIEGMDDIRRKIDELKEKGSGIGKEVEERTIGYVVGAFGLVAGLAWNDAVKALIEFLFPLNANTVLAKFIYAGLVTLIVVIITGYLVRAARKKGEDAAL